MAILAADAPLSPLGISAPVRSIVGPTLRSATVIRVALLLLVVGNLGLILVNRSWTKTVVGGLRTDRNPALAWVLSGAVGFLVLLLPVPFLRELFRFVGLDAAEQLIHSGVDVVIMAQPPGFRPRVNRWWTDCSTPFDPRW